jgi:hypothetical protein
MGKPSSVATTADDAFDSPERAALAEWDAYPQAQARVITVESIDEDHAVVVTDTVPSHPMWNYCFQTSAGGVFGSDHD